MNELFQWIRNITYYLIFITVVTGLLPDRKYEKYLRLFAGMILILLVMKPFTGDLRLDERLAYYFEAISFRKEAGELTGKLSKMEGNRLESMIAGYEEAVALDIKTMAEGEGFTCLEAKAEIDRRVEETSFGRVRHITLRLRNGEEERSGYADMVPVKDVEEIKIKEIHKDLGQREEPAGERKRRQEENSRLSGLRRKIGEYYDLEEQDIEIQVEDGKG